jgi:hypothetical protein
VVLIQQMKGLILPKIDTPKPKLLKDPSEGNHLSGAWERVNDDLSPLLEKIKWNIIELYEQNAA